MLTLSTGATENTSADGVIHTPITETRVAHDRAQQTESLQTVADRWGLTVEEIKRYQELMKGPLGYWNSSIDPLLALGMFAETPEQERRYAELYAQQEFEFTQRALHFQRTYRSAFNRLYPNTNVLDSTLLKPYYDSRELKKSASKRFDLARRQFLPGDQVLYFIEPACGSCAKTINSLLLQVSNIDNAKVNVYLLDVQSDQQVQQWASKYKINPRQIEQGKLSLNRDEGLYQSLKQHSVNPSSNSPIFLHRNDRYFQLDMGDLGL